MVKSWIPALLVIKQLLKEDEQTGIEIVQRQRRKQTIKERELPSLQRAPF